MKKLAIAVLTCTSILLSGTAFAADPVSTPADTTSTVAPTKAETKADTKTEKKELSPQQKKMGACSRSAKEQGLKGDARKAFMKECLSSKGKK